MNDYPNIMMDKVAIKNNTVQQIIKTPYTDKEIINPE
jgi:hypothetical protein